MTCSMFAHIAGLDAEGQTVRPPLLSRELVPANKPKLPTRIPTTLIVLTNQDDLPPHLLPQSVRRPLTVLAAPLALQGALPVLVHLLAKVFGFPDVLFWYN